MNCMYMYQGKSHMPPPNTTSGTTCISPHCKWPYMLLIILFKFKGPMEPSPHSKTTSPHHYSLANLQNNTSTLQVVEPPALLRMGLPDPALPVGEPSQAGVNRCQWRCRPHTTSSPHKVLYIHPPLSKQWNRKPSLQVLHTLRLATWTNGVSSLTASGQYHWTH